MLLNMEVLNMQNNILKMKRRMIIVLVGTIVMGVILIFHTGYIQFVQGEDLQRKANGQQSSERAVTRQGILAFTM